MNLNIKFGQNDIKLISALLYNAITSVSWIEYKDNLLTLLINRVNWDFGGYGRKSSILTINNITKFSYKLPNLYHSYNLYGDGFIPITNIKIYGNKMYIKSTDNCYISFKFFPSTYIILEDVSNVYL